jgi:DNA-binding transcriptional LysR family regulator
LPISLELRHLRYFLAVADELHFGRAAQRVHIAQPALSQQIQKLEAEVGTTLFDRNRREVRLSPAGVAFRPFAERALADASAGAEAARRAAAGEIGHLTVGFIETAASSVIPGAVRRFRTDRPDVGLTLRELGVGVQLEGLHNGRLDVAIVRPPIDSEDLSLEQIADEGLVAAVPSTHPLAGRKRVTARAVADQPLVALTREMVPGLYDQVLALRQEEGGVGAIAQEATSIQAVLGLVAAGLGVAIMPASVRSLSREGVEFVSIQSAHRSTMVAAWRRDDASPLVPAFLRAARSAARR